jgi:NAD(P)H dehydrogenase (quinone)
MADAGASVLVRTVEEVQWEEMLSAKGVIVGTPVRFGDVDWQIKRLFDTTAYQDYPGPLSGKVGGAFTGGGRPGSGAELALLSMLHILLNHGMVIQGNAFTSHYGPVALRDFPEEEVTTICKAWGKHWAELAQKLYPAG